MSRSQISRPVLLRALGVAPLLVIVAGFSADADVSLVDRWGEAGSLSLDNGARRISFSKGDAAARVYDISAAEDAQVMSLVPFDANDNRATGITSCRVTERLRHEARCQVLFAVKEQSISATFVLNSNGAIRVEPSTGLKGMAVSADFAYGVLPSRHLDDNVYDAAEYPKPTHLHVPSENMLVGLVRGGSRVVALVWPPGDQSARIALAGAEDNRRIEALEVTLAGKELFVGAFSGPGIWRQLELSSSYEQQDVTLDWKPPFEAAWKTQLSELGVPTTFRRVSGRKRPWRPTVGFYIYPFFSEDGKTILRLHKKLARTGNALIYALEGHDQTPYAFLTANLAAADQQQIAELYPVEHYYVLDPSPTEGGLLMNAHCAGRDQLKRTTLAVGAYAREVAFLDTHMADRVHECEFIVTHHVQRSLDCMEALDGEIADWIREEAGNPGVLSFLRGVRETLAAMEEEYRGRLRGDSPEDIIRHIHEVEAKFRSVIREDAGIELCPEILSYINELNAIISLEEDQGRRFGSWARKLFQQAGYACVSEPLATEYARAIRSRLRDRMRYRQYESPRTSGSPRSLLPPE